jgi:hypothetical protein
VQKVPTESLVIIADTISAFAFHVFTLHNELDFTFVDFNPFSLNLVAKTSAEDY